MDSSLRDRALYSLGRPADSSPAGSEGCADAVQSPAQKATAVIHILSGQYKGRKLLPPPASAETRPITSLARKSLFGILRDRLEGASVADLYCGTGTLGLEALSNGATACCFGERDRKVLERLRRNIETLGCGDCCTVWAGDVTRGLNARLAGLERPLDVAFVDPPYAHSRRWDWSTVERTLLSPLANHLSDDGVVVLRLETQVERPDVLAGLTVQRLKEYGSMAVALLGRPVGGINSAGDRPSPNSYNLPHE